MLEETPKLNGFTVVAVAADVSVGANEKTGVEVVGGAVFGGNAEANENPRPDGAFDEVSSFVVSLLAWVLSLGG